MIETATRRELAAIAAHARAWLFDHGLPFWFEHGIDRRHGGFLDLVGVDGSPVAAPKRTFVQARQICAYVDAGRMGWHGDWRAAVEIGLETIDRHCRHPDGGFVHRLTASCAVDEPRRDLYDHAFVALAWAKAGAALQRRHLVDGARQVLADLDARWARPPAGYFEGELPPVPPRRQNPHMHLLEAAIEIAQAAGAQAADRARADALASLFDRFFDTRRGVLLEYRDENLEPLAGPAGEITEPGHHFEWVWLLHHLERLTGRPAGPAIRALWSFAVTRGVDPERNVAVDEVLADGTIRSRRARLWPQTERLKACLGLAERGDPLALGHAIRAYAGLQPYLATPAPGAFYDKLNADGSFVAEPARASSLYHLASAYAELQRVSAVLA